MTGRGPGRPLPRYAGRHPAPPKPLLDWVEEYGGVGPDGADSLAAGIRALRGAMATPPNERRAAWALLAADALLTWAVEDAADASDPGATLEAVLRGAQLAEAPVLPAAPIVPDGKPGRMES